MSTRHTFLKNQVQPFSASFLHQYHPQYHPHITIIIVNNPTLHIPQTVHIVFIFPAQSNTPSMQNKHIFLTNIKYLFTIIITMYVFSALTLLSGFHFKLFGREEGGTGRWGGIWLLVLSTSLLASITSNRLPYNGLATSWCKLYSPFVCMGKNTNQTRERNLEHPEKVWHCNLTNLKCKIRIQTFAI